MNCDLVNERLPDYSMGTLVAEEAERVRRHLRGCAACRGDAATLDEGVRMFATAAHSMDPPSELKERVMAVMSEEWAEAPASMRGRPAVPRWLAIAAAIIALAAGLSLGAVGVVRANRVEAEAASYRQFLHALGGKEVRVATLHGSTPDLVDGSAVLYDSERGQSWALVLLRAPGYSGTLNVQITSKEGRSIDLREMEIDADGDGATWLVTSSDISKFDAVRLTRPDGRVLASGRMTSV